MSNKKEEEVQRALAAWAGESIKITSEEKVEGAVSSWLGEQPSPSTIFRSPSPRRANKSSTKQPNPVPSITTTSSPNFARASSPVPDQGSDGNWKTMHSPRLGNRRNPNFGGPRVRKIGGSAVPTTGGEEEGLVGEVETFSCSVTSLENVEKSRSTSPYSSPPPQSPVPPLSALPTYPTHGDLVDPSKVLSPPSPSNPTLPSPINSASSPRLSSPPSDSSSNTSPPRFSLPPSTSPSSPTLRLSLDPSSPRKVGLTPRGNGQREGEGSERVAPKVTGSWAQGGKDRGISPQSMRMSFQSMRDRNKTITIEDMGAWMADSSRTVPTPGGEGEGSGVSMGTLPDKKGSIKGKKSKKKAKTMTGEGTIFGMSLQELYEQSGHPIPVFVVHCLKYFKRTGALKFEGIFRLSGLKGEVEQMKFLFPTGVDLGNFSEVTEDPNAVASLLKLFYRLLPEPVMTSSLSWEVYELFQSIPPSETQKRIQKMKEIMARLPMINMINARFLLEFLNTILIYSEVNKMTVQNLSIVWGPNLFRVENEKNSMSVVASQFDIAATDFLISHYEEICEGLGTGSLCGSKPSEGGGQENKPVIDTQEVCVWPFSPSSGTVQRKIIQKKSRTCNDFVKSLAVRMGVDPSEIQLVKVETKAINGETSLNEALEGGDIALMWKGKLTDTISLPQK